MDKGKFKLEKDTKPIDLKWLIIISLVIWLIGILLPFLFSLSMNLNLDATIDAVPDTTSGLPGSVSESNTKIVSSDYKAVVVPSKLEENKGAFIAIGFLHGPALMTGTPLTFNAIPGAGNSELVSHATIKLSNSATPIVFFLVLILFILFIDWVLGNPNSALKFIVTLSLVWLIWSLFTWALGGLTMRPVNEVFNHMLTEEQGSAKYILGIENIFNSATRIFIIGMIVWVGSLLYRQSRTKSSVTT